MLTVSQDSIKFNLALLNPNVRTKVEFAVKYCPGFIPERFIEFMSSIKEFPFLNYQHIVEASDYSGGCLQPRLVLPLSLNEFGFPFLASMRKQVHPSLPRFLIQIDGLRDGKIEAVDQNGQVCNLDQPTFLSCFSGVGIFAAGSVEGYSHLPNPVDDRFHVLRWHSMQGNLQEIINFFEQKGFVKNAFTTPPALDRGRCEQGIFGLGYRSYASLSELPSSGIRLLDEIKQNIPPDYANLIDGFHCLKLPPRHSHLPGYDSGVNLNRHKAFHMPWNNSGGQVISSRTFFRQDITISNGEVLAIECCDTHGRTHWNSEWRLMEAQDASNYLVSVYVKGKSTLNKI